MARSIGRLHIFTLRASAISLLLAICLQPGIVSASVIVQVENKSTTAGQSGFFDVFLGASGSNPTLQGYNVRLKVSPGGGGVTLGLPQKTDVGVNPRVPVFPDALSPVSSDGTTIYAASDTGTPVTMANQAGLARIPFTTTLAASGAYALVIDTSPIGTLLANGNGDPIAFSATNGLLNVASAPPILLGDFNRDGHVTAADVSAMLTALKDLNAYKSALGLSDAQLRSVGDVNGDFNPVSLTGGVNNADTQALLNLLKAGGGSAIPVPEPSSLVVAVLGLAAVCIVGRWQTKRSAQR